MTQKTYRAKMVFSIIIFCFLKNGLTFSLFAFSGGRALFSINLTNQMGTLGVLFSKPILLYDRTPYEDMIDELFGTLNSDKTEQYINKELDTSTPVNDEV